MMRRRMQDSCVVFSVRSLLAAQLLVEVCSANMGATKFGREGIICSLVISLGVCDEGGCGRS